jgi:predicted NAD-dependent protein-ADP-ribosyltransferase YbiA (DUF1768 family)
MVDNDKFLFYSKSADKKPGKGTGEYVNDIKIYKELSEIPNWRHILSNFYISPFILDDNEWNSVEHFFHAVKFRDDKKKGKNYDFYKTFTLNSGSDWSENPLYAKQSGKAGRVSETTGKVFDKKIGNTKIPKDVKMRPDFYSNKVERRLQILAFFAKFTQNEELKHMLLSTGDAELWHYVGRGASNQLWKHLMNVRRCIRKYDAEYDLQEISKFNTNDVTEMLQ